MYTIDKGIPIGTSTRRGESKYPWPEMEHGDSVLLPVDTAARESHEAAQRRYSNNARGWLSSNRPKWKVVTRREGKGIRVWFIDEKVEDDAQDTEIEETINFLMDTFAVPAAKREDVYHLITEALSNAA